MNKNTIFYTTIMILFAMTTISSSYGYGNNGNMRNTGGVLLKIAENNRITVSQKLRDYINYTYNPNTRRGKLMGELMLLTDEQFKTLVFVWYRAKKMYPKFKYTLLAIAWQESAFGVFTINPYDNSKSRFPGSYGVFHALLSSTMSRKYGVGVFDGRMSMATKYNSMLLATELTNDYHISMDYAAKELYFWNGRWKGQSKKYSKTVASYNTGGCSLHSKKPSCKKKVKLGKRYAREILTKIAVLRYFLKLHDIR
jgi:soluble lytic murein transglycosylase-like protein